ncbi:FAD-binding oxidoreductase, partial [Burkholderia contaminans]
VLGVVGVGRGWAGGWAGRRRVVGGTNAGRRGHRHKLLGVLGGAGRCEALAGWIVDGFDDPRRFSPWWFEPSACAAMIREHSARTE